MDILESKVFWHFVSGFALLVLLGLAGAFFAGSARSAFPEASPVVPVSTTSTSDR
ncbi:MAG: hypothetical protein HYS74_02675 [Parcubacteria group bacterium]|nr:hypothetical protein [Parcubacteria group bacterium]